jgi:hypothetical protein
MSAGILYFVIPAKAGIHFAFARPTRRSKWIPAFAGMTALAAFAGMTALAAFAGMTARVGFRRPEFLNPRTAS